MAISVVQARGKTPLDNVNSSSDTFASSVTNGNVVIVVIDGFASGGLNVPEGAVTDNKGNTYHRAVQSASAGSGETSSIFYAYNVTGGASFQVTVNPDGTDWFGSFGIIEVSGLKVDSDPLDKTTSATGSSTTPNTGTTAALSRNDEFVVAVFGSQYTTDSAITTDSVSPAWTDLYQEETGSLHQTGAAAYRIVTNGAAQSCGWTQPSSAWSAAIATFKRADISSPSLSPSSSPSASPSPSSSVSASVSLSPSSSESRSPSLSPSSSQSPSSSPSLSPSSSTSLSPSISGSASPSVGYELYSKGNYVALPADNADLENLYTGQEVTDVGTKDDVRVCQEGAAQFMIHEFKNFIGNETTCAVEWEGQSSLASTASPIYLQVYNHNSGAWETLTSDNSHGANVDFSLLAEMVSVTNYKDVSEIISFRVYQEAV